MILREENYLNENPFPLYHFELLKVVIPLCDFFRSLKQRDIYNGTEGIPFDKRDSEFKKILLSEFVE
jgi:hypothetical protein